ncbi:Protein atp6v1fnb [Bulinus truncatus]|nr:Protein atp6v1fnb [Bulinus truncatus]
MARNPYANTQMQNFWKETVEKEAAARLHSFAKMKGQERNKPRQLEVFRKKIEDNKPSVTLLEKLPALSSDAKFSRKTGNLNLISSENALNDAILDEPEMRAPPPSIRKLLYDGFTKEEKGRYHYLQQRHQKIPEEKFAFPTCSSWEYGWKLEDVIKKEDIKKPKFGRTKIVEDTFYTRNGIVTNI